MKKKVSLALAVTLALGGAMAVHADDMTTIKWVLPVEEEDADEAVFEEINRQLAEKIGVQVEFITISMGEYDTRTQLMTTTGEDYDIMYTCSWLNDFASNVNREAFLPLNDLLETDAAAGLKEVLPDWIYGASTVGGNIYAVPNYQILNRQYGIVVQKELADKYGLDMSTITNIHDIEPFLEQIRDNEPDYYPIYEADCFDVCAQEPCDYWVTDAGLVRVMVDESGTTDVISYFDDASAIECARIANDYYQRGFIRNDVISTLNQNESDLTANRYACAVEIYKPSLAAEWTASYGIEYVAAPITKSYIQCDAGASTMNAINVNSEHPEEAIKVLATFFSDPEVYNTLLYGLEGVNYTKVGENRIELIEDSGYNRSGDGWMFGNQFNAYLLPGNADDVWEQSEALNQNSMVSQLLGFTFDQTDVETEVAQLNAIGGNGAERFVAEDFDAFIENWKATTESAGLTDCIAACQEQVNAFVAAN